MALLGLVKRRGLKMWLLELVIQASRHHMISILFRFHPEDSRKTRKKKSNSTDKRERTECVKNNKNTFLAVCSVCLQCYNVCLHFKPQLFRLDAITVPYIGCACKKFLNVQLRKILTFTQIATVGGTNGMMRI